MADVTLVAGVVLRNEKGQYLLVQEAKERVYGLWNWPAGKADPGETLQETAIREAKEETNLDVRLTDQEPFYEGRYKMPGNPPVTHATHLFRAEVLGGRLAHQEGELLDTQWFSPAEIKRFAAAGKTRGEWIVKAMDMVEAGKT
jgi:8-oxo-dGTP pyrophosphatase MutT (NUDIX family)